MCSGHKSLKQGLYIGIEVTGLVKGLEETNRTLQNACIFYDVKISLMFAKSATKIDTLSLI